MEVKHLGHKRQVHLLQTQKTQISENTITFLTHKHKMFLKTDKLLEGQVQFQLLARPGSQKGKILIVEPHNELLKCM